MTDVHSSEIRRKNMSAIKSKNTKPELWLRKRLHAAGFRYRLNPKDLPGKPDIVLPRYKAVIFVHGCFWHAHDCHLFKLPATRTDFWKAKLYGNRDRDLLKKQQLENSGWRVLTVWECAISGKERIKEDILIKIISNWIRTRADSSEIP
ncbi:very short patch repair endonuclease [Amphritea balenae]|uniref:Very short patch repair endonuclease n=1 Tax=Amphritea balenae TaxID=452629 RepID=A0A3P1SMY9_9GAMM|nr:very short patch repair endonuclease [Amphritea balenae]RRC98487.1 DNA mismatch endonuclease Vsr [Amphritea balenae]GGK64884.1 very short patch repair endonuclease [Amphritea balenae]